MSVPPKKDLRSRVEKLEAQSRRTRQIAEMTAALKTASDQWEEVCRVYTTAWDDAYKNYVGALTDVRSLKELRAKREAEALSACIGLAFVFLPIIGGEIALTMAPILSTRAKLLTNTVGKKLGAKWTDFANKSPIVSTAIAKLAEHSKDEATAFASEIKTGIIEKLKPKFSEPEVPPAKTPKDALIDKMHMTREFMDQWVQSCAKWNVEDGWQGELVPVAYEMFMHHPWVKSAPSVRESQSVRENLTRFIEMVLWFRWARGLDEPYWRRVADWLDGEYKTSAEFQRYQVKGRMFSMAVDILDMRPVRARLMKLDFDTFYYHYSANLLDPESNRWGFPEVRVTLNVHSFIQLAKHSYSTSILEKLLPNRKLGWDFQREIKKL